MIKPCQKCGGNIDSSALSPSHFQRRRYCSRSCGMSDRDPWWLRKENLSQERLRNRGLAISLAKTGAFGTQAERFASKLQHLFNGCIVWTGATDDKGYGLFRPDGRRGPILRSHIWALTRLLGRPIADGFGALHTCDCPPCVNTDHLYEGTAQDNADDRDGRGSAIERRERWRIACGL